MTSTSPLGFALNGSRFEQTQDRIDLLQNRLNSNGRSSRPMGSPLSFGRSDFERSEAKALRVIDDKLNRGSVGMVDAISTLQNLATVLESSSKAVDEYRAGTSDDAALMTSLEALTTAADLSTTLDGETAENFLGSGLADVTGGKGFVAFLSREVGNTPSVSTATYDTSLLNLADSVTGHVTQTVSGVSVDLADIFNLGITGTMGSTESSLPVNVVEAAIDQAARDVEAALWQLDVSERRMTNNREFLTNLADIKEGLATTFETQQQDADAAELAVLERRLELMNDAETVMNNARLAVASLFGVQVTFDELGPVSTTPVEPEPEVSEPDTSDGTDSSDDTPPAVSPTTTPPQPGNGTVEGTAGSETIGLGFTDADGDAVTTGDDTIAGIGGNDTIDGDGGNDTVILLQSLSETSFFDVGSGQLGIFNYTTGETVLVSNVETLSFTDQVVNVSDITLGSGVMNGTTLQDILAGDINGSNDLFTTGDGNDHISGNAGNDTIDAGNGNDTLAGGTGRDVYVFRDGTGDDLILDFDRTDAGDGTTIDQLDVSGLTSDGMTPVTVDDVSVTDTNGDGTGDAILTFTGGETITLRSVSSADLSRAELGRMGIAAGFVDGTAGNDSMGAGFTDADGDMITAGADAIRAGAGDDTINAGAGDDSIEAGDGADEIVLEDGFGTDQITGGEGATDDDVINMTAVTADTNLVFTGAEAGTASDGTNTATFTEVERVELGSGNDIVDGTGATSAINVRAGAGNDSIDAGTTNDTIDGGAGSDTLNGGGGADSIDAGNGEDTLVGGADNDRLTTGTGRDTIVLADGSGDDVVTDFDMTDAGDGTTIDQLGVSGLTSDGVTPVTTADVTVTDTNGDGTGDAILTFTNGESLTLQGVLASQVDDVAELVSIGIAANADGIVNGTAGDDTMGLGYTDVDGDQITDNADVVVGAAGNDQIDGALGNDTIAGGTGNDTIDGGGGSDVIGVAVANATMVLNFEDGASTTAGDSSGNARVANYRGNATAGGTGWDGTGTGVTLDGAGDYVEIASNSSDQLTEGTVSLRFNVNDVSVGRETLFSRDANGFGGGGHLTVNTETDGSIKLRLQSGGTSYEIQTAAGLVTSGEWHHVAVSFGGDGLKLYLDGVEVASDAYTGGIAGNNEPWTIGAAQVLSSNGNADNLQDFFAGQIDEFAIFDSQLEAGQLAVLRAEGAVAATQTGSGDDSLVGAAGEDTINGGVGNDTITGGADGDTFVLADGSGNDVITDFDMTDSGDGTTVDQFDVSGLTSDGVNPVTTVDVTVTDTNGDGTGDAILTFTNGESVTLQGVVASQVDSAAELVSIGIPSGADGIVQGTGGDDTMNFGFADAGGDEIGVGGDSIEAGAGNDSVNANNGNDTIDGGAGNDTLNGGNDNDSLIGGAGNDVFQNNAGLNTLNGGDDADLFEVGNGSDTVFGGEGGVDSDTLSAAWSGDAINIVYTGAEAGTFSDDDGDTGQFSEIEALELTAGNDTVDGTADGVGLEIVAGDGADSILGGSGGDQVNGDGGNDIIDGRDGADTINGGAGDDTIIFDFGNRGTTDAVSFDGGNDNDTLRIVLNNGGVTDGQIAELMAELFAADAAATPPTSLATLNATLTSIERVDVVNPDGTTTTFNFDGSKTTGAINGSAGADNIGLGYIDGDGDAVTNGTDLIFSNGGNDDIDGENGSDTIIGGAGNDTIDGDDGDDIITGGGGDDVFTRSDGKNTLVGGAGADYLGVGFGNDTVYGGEGGVDADTLSAGDTNGDMTVTFNSDEAGTFAFADGDSGTFAEIEAVKLTNGNDTLNAVASSSGVAVQARGGADVVTGGSGNDTIDGGADADTVTTGAGRDTIVLSDGSGADVVADFDVTDSGDGTTVDQLDVSGLTSDGVTPVTVADVTVTDTNGDGTGDAILTFTGGESVTLQGVLASHVDDASELQAIGIPIVAPSMFNGSTPLNSPGSYDTTISSDQASLWLPSTDDTVQITNGANMTDLGLGDGNNYVDGTGAGTVTNLHGGAGNDEVYFGTGSAVSQFSMLGGNDTFASRGNVDTVTGGAGNDRIDVASADYMYGGTENDTLSATGYVRQADGGDGNDQVSVGSADSVGGGEGNDMLVVAGNVNTLSGGAGDDLLIAQDVADLQAGLGNDTVTVRDVTLAALEDGDDVFTADGLASDVRGGIGDDTITLNGGGSAIGESGNDTFILGGSAATTLDGGAGVDTFEVTATAATDDKLDSLLGGNDRDRLNIRYTGDIGASQRTDIENQLATLEASGSAGTVAALNLYIDSIETVNIVDTDGTTIRTFSI